MVRLSQERVLLVGDVDRQIFNAVSQALPTAQVRTVDTLFDAIAELSQEKYTAVLASAEPLERRPEAAVKTLRQLSGNGRLLLFGHPTLEPLSQKMLQFGLDDYLIVPATAGEILDVLKSKPPMPAATGKNGTSPLGKIQLAEIILEALIESPRNPVEASIRQIDAALTPTMSLQAGAVDVAGADAIDGADGDFASATAVFAGAAFAASK